MLEVEKYFKSGTADRDRLAAAKQRVLAARSALAAFDLGIISPRR
jgi:hypothetical protein